MVEDLEAAVVLLAVVVEPVQVPGTCCLLGAKEREVGVLVRGGIGAGAFPFDTGGVGSELA